MIDSLFKETSVDSEYYPINILRVGADKAHAVGADGNGTREGHDWHPGLAGG